MYKVGSFVVYGSEGVCKIVEIVENSFSNMESPRKYYVLERLSNSTDKIFVPCDNEILVSRIQKLLSAKEMLELISQNDEPLEWIADSKLRNKTFKEILSTYNRRSILALAKLLYLTKLNLDESKRFYASDEEILRKIVAILYAELSLVFEIQEEEVLPFILGEIKCKTK